MDEVKNVSVHSITLEGDMPISNFVHFLSVTSMIVDYQPEAIIIRSFHWLVIDNLVKKIKFLDFFNKVNIDLSSKDLFSNWILVIGFQPDSRYFSKISKILDWFCNLD